MTSVSVRARAELWKGWADGESWFRKSLGCTIGLDESLSR